MTTGRRLYLAYGSNLSRAQMLNRCPQAQPIAAVTIHGWRLGFFGPRSGNWGPGGVASLVEDANATAFGAVYRLSVADEALLDVFEGYASFYGKREDFVQFIEPADLAGGEFAEYIEPAALRESDVVFAYLKNDLSFENAPARAYLETIHRGYADWGLPRLALASIRPLA